MARREARPPRIVQRHLAADGRLPGTAAPTLDTQGGSELTSSKYLHLMIGTGLGLLTAYLNGRELKRWPYALPNE
jgi:hypothetical protein